MLRSTSRAWYCRRVVHNQRRPLVCQNVCCCRSAPRTQFSQGTHTHTHTHTGKGQEDKPPVQVVASIRNFRIDGEQDNGQQHVERARDGRGVRRVHLQQQRVAEGVQQHVLPQQKSQEDAVGAVGDGGDGALQRLRIGDVALQAGARLPLLLSPGAAGHFRQPHPAEARLAWDSGACEPGAEGRVWREGSRGHVSAAGAAAAGAAALLPRGEDAPSTKTTSALLCPAPLVFVRKRGAGGASLPASSVAQRTGVA